MDVISLAPFRRVARTPGTGVVVAADGELHAENVVRFVAERQVPERMILVRFAVDDGVPRVPLARRTTSRALCEGVLLAQVRFGFDDEPNVPEALAACPSLPIDASTTRYYLIPESWGLAAQITMARWRKWLFCFMAQASMSAVDYLHLPIDSTTIL